MTSFLCLTRLLFHLSVLGRRKSEKREIKAQRQKRTLWAGGLLSDDVIMRRSVQPILIVCYFSRWVSGLHCGGVNEKGGDDARADGLRRNRQRWEASGFKPATGRHRCQVTLISVWICLVWFFCFIKSFLICFYVCFPAAELRKTAWLILKAY